MLDTEKRSGIGRPLDPNYPTNRAIVAVAVLVGLVGGAVQLFITGSGLLDSLVWSVEAAGGVFLAWALSRELDPDNEMSAFVSAGLWILSLAVINAPGLLALLWFLWSLRIVNRTSGLAAKPLDSVLFLTLGSWLAFQTSGIYIVMTAVVFVLDGLLEPANRRQYIFAGLSALPGLALFLALETGMLGVFLSLDLLLFFVFWEIGLVPMYFLIDQWGSPTGERELWKGMKVSARRYASFKFIVYTMAGSLGLLLAIQMLGVVSGTFDLIALFQSWPSISGTLFGLSAATVKTAAFWAFARSFDHWRPLTSATAASRSTRP